MESQEFDAGKIQPAEVPAKQIETLRSIRGFTNQLFVEECQFFNGPSRYKTDAKRLIEAIFRERLSEAGPNLSFDAPCLLKRDVEYEICKDVIDYRNVQLERLTRYIEKQPIWKAKFRTSINVINTPAAGGFSQLISGLEKSEEVDRKYNFAIQNINFPRPYGRGFNLFQT